MWCPCTAYLNPSASFQQQSPSSTGSARTRDAAVLDQSGSLVTEPPAPELDVAQLNHLADAAHPTKASFPRHFQRFLLPKWCAPSSRMMRAVSLTANCELGCPCGLSVHPGRESCPLQTVSRDAQIPHRGSPCIVPQARRQRHSAHHRRAGQCAIRLPASRRALHGAHHQPPVQHPPRHRFATPVRSGGDEHLPDFGRERNSPKCLRASQRIR